MPLARLEHPKDGRADLVLAQPERRNATSIGLLEEAIRLIQGVGSDRSVLVIRGEGPHFCAGIDLDEVLEEWKDKENPACMELPQDQLWQVPLAPPEDILSWLKRIGLLEEEETGQEEDEIL